MQPAEIDINISKVSLSIGGVHFREDCLCASHICSCLAKKLPKSISNSGNTIFLFQNFNSRNFFRVPIRNTVIRSPTPLYLHNNINQPTHKSCYADRNHRHPATTPRHLRSLPLGVQLSPVYIPLLSLGIQ